VSLARTAVTDYNNLTGQQTNICYLG